MAKRKMKIALVHDYIKEYGGAERVLEALHEIWPDAPIFTTIYLPKHLGPHKKRFSGWDIRTSWLQKIPFKAKLISPFRLIAPFIFRQMDLSDYDVVIVSATGAYNPNLIKTDKATHICYCHTPPRYLYGYPTARDWRKNIVTRIFGEIANHFLRMVDFKSSQNVDYFIANSEEVGVRIKKFYRKDAVVIYPPIDTKSSKKHVASSKGRMKKASYQLPATSYYLTGGRLARAKRFDLAVEACTKLNLPLKVFGKSFAGYGEELKKMASGPDWPLARRAGPTIEFLGEVTEKEKWELIKNAKAYISPSLQEDFGMLNLEVNAGGTPVIAYKSGGAMETVIEGKTGIFFDKPAVESLMGAIRKFRKTKISSKDCIAHAKKFSKERFKKEMINFVKNHG
jgi:glycosyltransferase involved in cell wall biosynthesis